MRITKAQRLMVTAVADAVAANNGQPVHWSASVETCGVTRGHLYSVLVRCFERDLLSDVPSSGGTLVQPSENGLRKIGRAS